MGGRKRIQVQRFGEQEAQNSDGVFNGTLFPAMEGSAEKRACAQTLVDQQMLAVFCAVVVSQGAAEVRRERTKSADDAVAQL